MTAESSKQPSLERAISLATMAHAGQIDEDGLPHIVHALEVMFTVKEEYLLSPVKDITLEEIMIAAVLHDVVEDSDNGISVIERMFGKKVAAVVDAVSRRKEETYRDHIYRAKSLAAGRLVKIADNIVNRKRTHLISPKKASWRKKLEYKYDIARAVLNDADEPTWEGASFRVQYEDAKATGANMTVANLRTARYYIADPNGKEIEITEAEAENVKVSFIISN